MTISEIKRGDRVDYPSRDLTNGEVVRVGRATVWAVFTLTDGATFPVTVDPVDLRPHVVASRIQIGEFVLRDACGTMVWIESARTGEAMQTEVAKLESWIGRFWKKEF